MATAHHTHHHPVKLREQAYVTLSTARRRLLHRRVGDALQVSHTDEALDIQSFVSMRYLKSITYTPMQEASSSRAKGNICLLSQFNRVVMRMMRRCHNSSNPCTSVSSSRLVVCSNKL